MMKKMWRQEKGFTLIELLIVVAIIGVLAGIAVPRISQSLDNAKLSACRANQDAIQTAAELYYFENSSYPRVAEGGAYVVDYDVLVADYLAEEVDCPVDEDANQYLIDANGVVSCSGGH